MAGRRERGREREMVTVGGRREGEMVTVGGREKGSDRKRDRREIKRPGRRVREGEMVTVGRREREH